MNIINAKDIQRENISALIYGTPGTGKTTLLGKLQGRTLIVDIDKGTSVLAGYQNVDIFRVSGNLRELWDIPREFAANCPYDNIAIDTLSELERAMLNSLASKNNIGIPSLQDYGKVNNFLLSLCRSFRDIQANIFFTAWEQYSEIFAATGEKYSRIEPMIRNKNMESVCGLCDIIGRIYFDKESEQRRVWLEGSQTIVARDRIFKRQCCSLEGVIPNDNN